MAYNSPGSEVNPIYVGCNSIINSFKASLNGHLCAFMPHLRFRYNMSTIGNAMACLPAAGSNRCCSPFYSAAGSGPFRFLGNRSSRGRTRKNGAWYSFGTYSTGIAIELPSRIAP
jgi:hypothetical protein